MAAAPRAARDARRGAGLRLPIALAHDALIRGREEPGAERLTFVDEAAPLRQEPAHGAGLLEEVTHLPAVDREPDLRIEGRRVAPAQEASVPLNSRRQVREIEGFEPFDELLRLPLPDPETFDVVNHPGLLAAP